MTRRFDDGVRVGVRRLFARTADQRSREDLEAELDAHIAACVEHLVARGHSPEEARSMARARFGNFDDALETLHSSAEARDRRLTLSDRVQQLGQDARFILRGLRRSPAFTAGVVATLAIGLGINSAVFRIADRVLLRAPSGVSDPRALRRVNTIMPLANTAPIEVPAVSYAEARLILDSHAFARAGAYTPARSARLADGREIAAAYVDTGFFATLGVRADVGRLFDAQEADVGSNRYVAVVSHDFWQRELGGVALDRVPPLVINGHGYRVIGAMSRDFAGIDLDPFDVWLPLGVAELGYGTINGTRIPWYRTDMMRPLFLVARTAPGASDTQVAQQAGSALANLDASNGRKPRTIVLRAIVTPRVGVATDSSGKLVARLAGVALIVLLVACANAANLLLARALRRRREIAVRIALGARHAQIVRLLLVESVLLGTGGGIAAGLAGYWTGDALRRLLFPNARWATPAFDDRVLAFTLGAALIAGLAAGLAPAFQLSNVDVLSALKDVRQRAGLRGRMTRTTLVVLQTAFSLMLVIGSGLLVRSLQKLDAVNLGFEPAGLVTALLPARTFMGRPADPFAAPLELTASDLAQRLRGVPGVGAIALASTAPFNAHASMDVSVPGRPEPALPERNGPYYIAVSANYFSVMGTRVVRGRGFSESDGRGAEPVVVVGETFARYYWPDGDPFSSCLLLHTATCARVVGVVEDVRDTRGGGIPPIRFYLPLAQWADSASAVVVRAAPERSASIATIMRAAIPRTARPDIQIVSDRVDAALRPWKLASVLFTMLGIVALVLACVGVYSVMSYVASERIHELGVRVVLGATPRDIVAIVVGGGMRLLGVGILLGVIGAAASARLLSALLFDISPLDPLAYLAAVAALAGVGALASLVPALRVMRADPTIALRSE